MTVKRRTGRLVQVWPLQGGRARVMRTSGKSLGPGGWGADDEARGGVGGCPRGGREELGEAGGGQGPPGHCADVGFNCNQGSWTAPQLDSAV